MRMKVFELHDGVEVEGPTGEISVGINPTDEMHDVYIREPGSGTDDKWCKIVGDTYQHKEKIKKLDYGQVEWTGDYWQVLEDKVTEVCSVLLIAGVDVGLDAGAVASDRDWGYLREEVELDDDLGGVEEETLRIMVPPDGPTDKVSRSWAEDATEVGNYDSVEEFAEEFGLNVESDEEMKERLESSDEYSANKFSTEE